MNCSNSTLWAVILAALNVVQTFVSHWLTITEKVEANSIVELFLNIFRAKKVPLPPQQTVAKDEKEK